MNMFTSGPFSNSWYVAMFNSFSSHETWSSELEISLQCWLVKLSSKLQSGANLITNSPFSGLPKCWTGIMYALSSGSSVLIVGWLDALPVNIWRSKGGLDLKFTLLTKFTHFKSQTPCSIPSPCLSNNLQMGKDFLERHVILYQIKTKHISTCIWWNYLAGFACVLGMYDEIISSRNIFRHVYDEII